MCYKLYKATWKKINTYYYKLLLQAVVAEPYLLRMRILVLLLLLSVVAVTLSRVVEEREEAAEGPETQGRVELIKPFNLQFFWKWSDTIKLHNIVESGSFIPKATVQRCLRKIIKMLQRAHILRLITI